MSAVTRLPGLLRISVIAATLASFAAPALAQATPDTEQGRYTLAPTSGGFIRLDTQTGVVSHCADRGNGWTCYALPEQHVALDKDIAQLRAENEQLRAQLAARDSALSGKAQKALPKTEAPKPGEPDAAPPKVEGRKSADTNRNSIEVPLPSDRDMDRVMSFVERAWRRLIEMAARVQRDQSGGI